MKIETLYEFIILARYMNFTTAATNLHTSQPNLSKHIAELEQEIGAPLFQRDRNLKLTAVGSAFLEDAMQMQRLYKRSLKRAKEVSLRSKEELVIQEPYIVDLLSEILFKSVMHFKAENPYVTTKYYTEQDKKSIELLEQGKIDIATTVDSNDIERINKISEKKDLIFYPVAKEPLQVWMNKNHPLARKERITLIDLARTTINVPIKRNFDPMRFTIIDLFKRAMDAPLHLQTFPCDTLNEFFMNTNNKTAVFLVTPTLAKSPLLTMQHKMVARPIGDDAYLISYLVLRSNYQKQSIDRFLETLERVVAMEIEHMPDTLFLDEIGQAANPKIIT